MLTPQYYSSWNSIRENKTNFDNQIQNFISGIILQIPFSFRKYWLISSKLQSALFVPYWWFYFVQYIFFFPLSIDKLHSRSHNLTILLSCEERVKTQAFKVTQSFLSLSKVYYLKFICERDLFCRYALFLTANPLIW